MAIAIRNQSTQNSKNNMQCECSTKKKIIERFSLKKSPFRINIDDFKSYITLLKKKVSCMHSIQFMTNKDTNESM